MIFFAKKMQKNFKHIYLKMQVSVTQIATPPTVFKVQLQIFYTIPANLM